MTSPDISALHRAFLGVAQPKPPTPAFPGPVPITVVAGGTPAGVRFTVDDLGPDWGFGPAPYPRPAAGMVPPAGTRGVAVFSADSASCYVVALYNWP